MLISKQIKWDCSFTAIAEEIITNESLFSLSFQFSSVFYLHMILIKCKTKKAFLDWLCNVVTFGFNLNFLRSSITFRLFCAKNSERAKIAQMLPLAHLVLLCSCTTDRYRCSSVSLCRNFYASEMSFAKWFLYVSQWSSFINSLKHHKTNQIHISEKSDRSSAIKSKERCRSVDLYYQIIVLFLVRCEKPTIFN